jgi:ring-1,2-phenylacetyl-CoA epoxidase subunit PaaE
MDKTFHQLTVCDVKRETPDAVSVSFEVPENLKADFAYTQGQYLTLKFTLKGQEARRAYSMCSSPLEEHLTVTVKRVKKGLVSNHINDNLKVGQQVEVMPPDGRFYTDLDEDHKKTYYFFGAGSGITPLFSIIKTILEKEPMSTIYLLYGNRNEDSIIFKEQLDQLQSRYAGQIFVTHTLSQPKREKSKGLGGLFSKGKITWEGAVGRIDRKLVKKYLEENTQKGKSAEYMICGPGAMILEVEAALENLGIDKKLIHAEHFTNDGGGGNVDTSKLEGGQVTVHLNGQKLEITVPAGKTVLDVLIDLKHDPPYSCTSGACSTCMAKVLNGSVKMDACYALDDDEVAEGFVLTCQTHPTSDNVEITFDV